MNRLAHTRLLACDLDGTMFPSGPDSTHAQALEAFARLRGEVPGLRVAYVTGRHLASALEAADFWSLPRPDLLSCDVGTSVYHSREDGAWLADEAYAVCMRTAMGGLGNADIRDLLVAVEALTLQDEERQGEFKTSFTLPRGEAGDAVMSAVVERLATNGTDVSLVRSSGVYEQDDLLDVLPPGATKASAVAHMARLLDVPAGRTIFAGDSRNDLDPLLHAGRGIVVANARPALLEALHPHLADTIYLAERPHLHGVVEGCRHFRVADDPERRP